MLGSYRKQIFIPYTRDIHQFMNHLPNEQDDVTAKELVDRLSILLTPQGLDNYEYVLKLVWRETKVEVDQTWTLKEIRQYPEYTFELRLFISTSLALNSFIV